MRRRWLSLMLATFCTFALGFVSALTFSLVGPVIKVLTGSKTQDLVSLSSLLGERIAAGLTWLLGRESVSTAELWATIPYILLIAAFLRAGLSLLQWFLWEQSSEAIARDLRSELVRLYTRIHPEQRRDQSRAIDQELSAAIGSDIRMVREYLVHFFGGFPRELVQALFYLVTLFLLDTKLALLFLLGIGPAIAILSRLGKKLRKRSQAVLGNTSALFEWLQQRFSGVETIKQFRTEGIEQQRMEIYSKELLKNFLRAARVKARTSPLIETVASLALVLVLWFAMKSIAAGELSSSTLLSFFSILAVLSQSGSKLGRYYNSNKEGGAALSRLSQLFHVMGQSQAPRLGLQAGNAQASTVSLQDVSYTYPGTESPALEKFTAQFAPGRIYAIAGPSGSGKSTLVKLLLGLWKPSYGQISFGISGREALGYLPQQVQLMPGSLAANLAYPAETVDSGRAQDALKRVGLDALVASWAGGIYTEIGEGGSTSLSGGQAQRVKIARLIYHRFPLIVIDEGTSALDPEVEALVFKTLRELAQEGSTILAIAHRISALQIADEVYVLKKGRTHFEGPPRKLLDNPEWRSFFDNEHGSTVL